MAALLSGAGNMQHHGHNSRSLGNTGGHLHENALALLSSPPCLLQHDSTHIYTGVAVCNGPPLSIVAHQLDDSALQTSACKRTDRMGLERTNEDLRPRKVLGLEIQMLDSRQHACTQASAFTKVLAGRRWVGAVQTPSDMATRSLELHQTTPTPSVKVHRCGVPMPYCVFGIDSVRIQLNTQRCFVHKGRADASRSSAPGHRAGASAAASAGSDMSKAAATVSWKEAVAGAISGALTTLFLHPLDVVRTRLQVQESGSNRYRGAVHAVRTITKREGVHGLYAGMQGAEPLVPELRNCACARAERGMALADLDAPNRGRVTRVGSWSTTRRAQGSCMPARHCIDPDGQHLILPDMLQA